MSATNTLTVNVDRPMRSLTAKVEMMPRTASSSSPTVSSMIRAAESER
ncbi:Uncharacterised protein [Mycobacterium tuberculosis]|uniref:Uncharacterized protein n=1 Tax=Mycobacterium tuberculosis TaxID=1773 RepID=A0A916L759_MYCTX|nr:Uncharacterised protein [Mycobacterium tuberculosis]COW08125.1 Uncharacterised protein [Mycobacterium tuberculosis]COW75788.1 Uncharacterised protein [Mycobacterium tuberculosis]COX44413.1 Uncharacterised protein [Mycobacterium tuberculosis]COY75094.1 Uncharacterised protein [Mycobacterium tuberculosis]